MLQNYSIHSSLINYIHVAKKKFNYIPYFLIGQLRKRQAGDESLFDSNSGTLIRLSTTPDPDLNSGWWILIIFLFIL